MSITKIRGGIIGACAVLAFGGGAIAEAHPSHHTGPRATHATVATHPDRARNGSSTQPRETLFETQAQEAALYAPYDSCLDSQTPASAATSRGGVASQRWKFASAAALSKCQNLDPLPPWQYDSSNPNSMTFVNAVVTCLRQDGVSQVQAVPAPAGQDMNEIAFGGPDNDQESITLGLQDITSCEHTALAATS